MTRLPVIPILVVSTTLLVSSCGRTDSVSEATQDGFTSLIQMVDEPPGANCQAGGVAIHSGLDANRNGVLDTGEIAVTKYVCNGPEGPEGPEGRSILFESDLEPPGDNCRAGGTVFRWGFDLDDDGVLDEDEILSTEYACNGLPGEGHNSLVNTLEEPPGDNCIWGGLAVQNGLDENDDGVLQPGEVDSTTYVCNGADGLSTLVRQADEEPGANCEHGGKAVLYGLDTDRSGYLEDSEILSTSYICNGAPGDPGHNSLFDAAIEPPGETCLAGGFLIKSGLDTNDNGILDEDEIQAEAYLCQGTPGDDGLAALVQVTEEDPGENCWYGGQKIETGSDDDQDGFLDPNEVDYTEYACNGEPGSNGSSGYNSLVETTPEPPGGNCPGGGQRIDVGLDYNRNGVLDSYEITATDYVCHGGDILMRVSNALWGGVCPRGGVKVESGFDDNHNGVLDDDEVDVEQYVCNLYIAQISAGLYHTCALVSDGTVRCWGQNGYGQLGDGTTDQREIPVAVAGLSAAAQIAAGGMHTCALLVSGSISCWGGNETGQLGDGTTAPSPIPVPVENISGALSVAAGGMHSCAMHGGGTVSCWGFNATGQLGNGSTSPSSTPVAVTGLSSAMSISCGGFHSCSTHTNGKVRCWGYNEFGQLGDGSTINRLTQVVVALNNAVFVTCGGYHTCAVIHDGTAWCWGRNDTGQLGDGTFTQRLIPRAVSGLSPVDSISAGGMHTCAVVSRDSAHCWGYNNHGQLGDGSTAPRADPLPEIDLDAPASAAAGGYHSCSLLSDGSARCWGNNESGQLGDGTNVDRHTPGVAPIQ